MKFMDARNQEEYKPVVLIVDDISRNLQLLGTVLKEINCKIAAATCGKQAISIAEKIHPDLILLDVMMPDMTGFEVAETLKANEYFHDIPIIFLTAKVETEDIVKGFESGGVDYVTKPFNSLELLSRVKTHLALKLSRDKEKHLIEELQKSLSEIKKLSGLLPICSHCKKIRDDQGYWSAVEDYIGTRMDTRFSHGLCPDCIKELYPDIAKRLAEKEKKDQDVQ